MQTHWHIDARLVKAIETIVHYVEQTTDEAPSPGELADALTRYFVLNEIKEHILMTRTDPALERPRWQDPTG